jgi:hypothetical protein
MLENKKVPPLDAREPFAIVVPNHFRISFLERKP